MKNFKRTEILGLDKFDENCNVEILKNSEIEPIFGWNGGEGDCLDWFEEEEDKDQHFDNNYDHDFDKNSTSFEISFSSCRNSKRKGKNCHSGELRPKSPKANLQKLIRKPKADLNCIYNYLNNYYRA